MRRLNFRMSWVAGWVFSLLLVASTLNATELLSVSSFGTDSGNDSSNSPTISPDGRSAAFVSRATDLFQTNDTNIGGTSMP